MAAPDSPAHALEVRRTIRASPERIYDAWTTADALARWFAPSAEFTTIVHTLELRVGGQYRLEMRHSSGSTRVAVGTYHELTRPTRLSFSWRWEGAAMADTLVTIELIPAGSSTELVLTHTGFPTPHDRDEHSKGWLACLSRIDTTMA